MSSDGGKLNEEYDILNTISQSDRLVFKRNKTVLEHKLICSGYFCYPATTFNAANLTYQNLGTFFHFKIEKVWRV